MLNHIAGSPTARVRLVITLALSIILPLITACSLIHTHNPIEVEKLLTPLAQADTMVSVCWRNGARQGACRARTVSRMMSPGLRLDCDEATVLAVAPAFEQ